MQYLYVYIKYLMLCAIVRVIFGQIYYCVQLFATTSEMCIKHVSLFKNNVEYQYRGSLVLAPESHGVLCIRLYIYTELV